MVGTAAVRLDALLSQKPVHVSQWADRAFEEAAGNRAVVLFGAGGLGRRALQAMRMGGTSPVAFADNSTTRQNTAIDGVPVLSPHEAIERYPAALFVISIWGAGSPHRQAHSRRQLQRLGAQQIISFPPLFWHFRSALPHYLIDRPEKVLACQEEVRAAFALLGDDASRAEFVEQIALRLSGDFDALSPPVRHPQYFPDDLVAWRPHERVLDGGAFDGDSLRAWLAWRGADFDRWIAIEPDPLNSDRFRAYCTSLSSDVQARIELQQCVLGQVEGTARIDAAGGAGAARVEDGSLSPGVEVPQRTIDTLAADAGISFIKLDIEGAELDALAGATAIIQSDRPVLAISAYHRQDHLWRVPLAIASQREDDHFVLRPHNEEGWDLVCYAVPRERLL